jgi:hypothetical protein
MDMKHSTKAVVIIAMLGGFGDCLMPGVFAEEKPITSSLGNPKIKLIGEMTLPSAINKIVFEKGKDGNYKIGKILTKEGFYSVDDKYGVKTILDLNRWKTEKERFRFEEAISHDGNYAIATILVQSPTDSEEYWPGAQYIVNLRTGDKIPLKDCGGWPSFSDETIALMDDMATATCFVDLKGNVLNSYTRDKAAGIGRGHRYGFFGYASGATFYDKLGNVLKVHNNIHQPQFRLNYDTGQVALHYCVYDESGKPKESKVGIYNSKGELQHEMTLPFDPNVDLGFSPDGRYVVVAARSGWVKLLDMENTKEVWSKNLEVFKYFYWHDPFPIMCDAKRFAFFTLEPASKKFMITIFTHAGDILGYIEINKRPEMEEYRLEFIPDTSLLVFHSDKYVNLYKIED